MESCWGSGWGTGSYTMIGSAASLSAQLTVPLPTGQISLVRVLFYAYPSSTSGYVQKVVLFTLLWCYQQGLQCALQNNIVLPLSQSCEPPLFSQPRPFSIQTPAPYSIRNLSESSLTQYELDSKSHISLCSVCLHVICCIVPPQIMPFVWYFTASAHCAILPLSCIRWGAAAHSNVYMTLILPKLPCHKKHTVFSVCFLSF